MEKISAAREVERYRIQEAKLAEQPFEGHVPVTGKPAVEKQTRRFSAGSVRVSTGQSLGDLAVLWLEPNSPDSFFQGDNAGKTKSAKAAEAPMICCKSFPA